MRECDAPTTIRRARGHRVPVSLQTSPAGCGVACMEMVLRFHGQTPHRVACPRAIRLGEHGVSALTLMNAAQRRGLRVRALATTSAGLAALSLPAIAFWNGNHFVVVERWRSEGVELVDPAIGRRRLTPAHFHRGFSGVVLLFEPDTKKTGDDGAGPDPRVCLGCLKSLLLEAASGVIEAAVVALYLLPGVPRALGRPPLSRVFRSDGGRPRSHHGSRGAFTDERSQA